jgi:DNA repair photolyase
MAPAFRQQIRTSIRDTASLYDRSCRIETLLLYLRHMLNLFPEENTKKDSLGQANIAYKNAASILTEAKGFMAGYDYTLNPYSGCAFGCTYCYAAFFSRSVEKMDNWGYWVEVKENALTLLKKQRGKLKDKVLYMSSVTDPYQPIERKLGLTRSLLKELLNHDVRLVIQTRSPLITNDTDILKQFKRLQVNMTVTTDSEKVRKAFEPLCPSNQLRLDAIKKVVDAGILGCITMTPLLPLENPIAFIQKLKETGCKHFIVQPFHKEKGRFVKGTREEATAILKSMNWTDEDYENTLSQMKSELPWCGVGKDGFQPLI